jgi:glycosyltransferase involved in cell wall biosynthesis
VELRIYGNTEECPAYVKELREIVRSDERVKFCGTFPNGQIGAVLASLDVLVVSSIWYENTPLVIYSAQAAGCPVIASNLGGMAEVVKHNDNGLLFTPGSSPELAECIKLLARNRERVRQLSTVTKPKSISQYVSELLQTYKEIVDQRRDVRCAV